MYKVLIVEDEHLELEALENIIENKMDNVEVAGKAMSGKEALEKVDALNPDIVLMDINIPEINGVEVLGIIKQNNPDIKVILITAHNEFEYAHQAIKSKVDDFLLKPIRSAQLIDSVSQSVEEIKKYAKNRFDEKMNEVIYSVVQKKYMETKNSLTEYVDMLYDHFGYDLISIQSEISHFMTELNIVAIDLCAYEIRSALRGHVNHQQFVQAYQNRYNLKMEIMKSIDKIFDRLLDKPDRRKNNIEDIINYIDRNCQKDISLDQVGEYANMSSYYLSKIFKHETGVNFVAYLTDRKIEIAKDMLVNTDVPIINIALDLSYHEPNYFSKVFKKSTGLTPTEYRKKYKKL